MQIIIRAQSGDREAFAILFEQYKNLVYKTAYLMLGESAEAEDALQEIFLQVYKSLSGFDPRKAKFTTWLYRVTFNYCLNHRRKKQPSFLYVATYHNKAGDFFVIESVGSEKVKLATEDSSESYTTASELKLTFLTEDKENQKGSSDKQFTSAIVETPEGAAFVINSTLPREQVKALAEQLVPVK